MPAGIGGVLPATISNPSVYTYRFARVSLKIPLVL